MISLAFYKRRPTRLQNASGLAATIGLSALLGYVQDAGTPKVWENAFLAAVLGVILYIAILAYLLYRYQPRHAKHEPTAPPVPRL
ncbi:MAG: hypothetical protein ACREC5_05315 [Thermoplasmata archaeon]